MENYQQVNWDTANKLVKKNESYQKKHQEDINDAAEELWDRMGQEDFSLDEFDQICDDYNLDPDELFERMI